MVDRQISECFRQIRVYINEVPARIGFPHPCEPLIQEICEEYGSDAFYELFESASDYTQCVILEQSGTLGLPESLSIRMCSLALQQDNIAIRDAAVTHLEHIRCSDTLSLLKNHSETERWLRDYIKTIVEELESEVQN